MSIFHNDLLSILQIRYPIIQAPMAGGITTNELVAAVSNHGALGMIGAGYQEANLLKRQIQALKKITMNPFGVNLFVPSQFQTDRLHIKKVKYFLQPYYEQYGIESENIQLPTLQTMQAAFEEQIEVILTEKVPICSFTFGVPAKELLKELKKAGVIIIGTATSVDEALFIEENDIDLVVVQGSEAGGHRATFLRDGEEHLIGLMSLVPQVVDHVSIPVIASGGMMDGRGVAAALCLGARAAQLGTAFLLTEESGAHPIHKGIILQSLEHQTIVTKGFSGKLARGIRNEFAENMRKYEEELPPFPIQNTLTKSIRSTAKEKGDHNQMSLWAGQGIRLGKKQTVASLLTNIIEDVNSILP